MKAVIIGNFGVTGQSINPQFYHTGMWYDYFSGDSVDVQNAREEIFLLPGEFHIYTDGFIEPPEDGLLSNLTAGGFTPYKFSIKQNYPNPFNPTTTIRFSVGGENMGSVHLDIYNITGQLVETLIDEKMTPGEYSILWNGSTAPSGIYFTRLTSGGKTKTMKMILLK
jgi:hypothetical protein